MKIFPLARVSNLSLKQREALRESLTHPFLLLFQENRQEHSRKQ